MRTVADDNGPVLPTVRANPLKSNAGTAADGADANIGSHSGTGKQGWLPGGRPPTYR